jgi:signal transduction histidine kinase
VSDHGAGFPPQLLARATDRFVVGDAARGEGVGLGLSIVAEHVRTLGAELTLANRADGGAVVCVRFRSEDRASSGIGDGESPCE